jgi:hypothetical protein
MSAISGPGQEKIILCGIAEQNKTNSPFISYLLQV